jgi:rubredoxin
MFRNATQRCESAGGFVFLVKKRDGKVVCMSWLDHFEVDEQYKAKKRECVKFEEKKDEVVYTKPQRRDVIPQLPKETEIPDYMKCPACGSMGITIVKKGFSLKKSVVGCLILGPLGLVAGAHRANEIQRYCSNCGCSRG